MEKVRILMLEDDEQICRLSKIIFERLRCDFVSVDAGEHAVSIYREAHESGNPFSAVILDLTVADGKGGREIIAPLREVNPEVCALLSTGDSEDPAVEDHLDLGFKGVVLKPYRSQDLQAALKLVGISI